MSGMLGTFFALFIPLGIALAYLVGLGYGEEPSLEDSYWRFGFLFPLAPAFLRSYILRFSYEFEPAIYYIE
jgi:hypothetical protein